MTSVPTPEPVGVARPRPLERFLGRQEASGGPFALLGVPPASCTDEVVVAALERQLARVNSHLQADTPEADEVRLALHAAAAQLLDPPVRRQLIARWGGRAAETPAKPAAPSPAPDPPPPIAAPPEQHAHVMLQHDAILALGLFGGWNKRTLRRLLSLANRRGLSAADAVAAVTRIARFRPAPTRRAAHVSEGVGMSRGPGISAPPPPAPTSSARAEPPTIRADRPPAPTAIIDDADEPDAPYAAEIDPFVAVARRALLFGAIALAAILLAAAAIYFAVRAPTPPPAPPPAAAANPAAPKPASENADKRFTAQGTLTEAPKPVAPAAEPVPTDPAVLTRELAACAEGLKVSPDEAAARFERAVATLGAQWASMTRESLVSAHDSVVEFVYRSSTIPAMTPRAIQAIAGPAALLDGAYSANRSGPLPPADRVAPAIWSVGMLVRLSREPDLPASAKASIESALVAALGPARPAIDPSFESGAAAAVMAASRVLILPGAAPPAAAAADTESWRRWARCAGGASGGDPSLRSRFILTGIEGLLLDAPEPTADKAVLAAIGELTASLTWRADEESRPRLLRWFQDKRITPADLNAVTGALATRSSAEGVDLTMVLSAVASDRARGELRDRYALTWNLGEPVDKGALAEAWSKAARDAVAASFERSSPVKCLEQAVILSRLGEAASWRWLGDANAADQIVTSLAEPVEKALADAAKNAPARSASDTTGDGAWGEKYLAARRNIPLRLDLLQKLGKGGSVGPVDAEVLAQEAFLGSPAEVKQRAAELAVQVSGSPALVNAALELLPRMPLIAPNGRLVELITARSLPGVRDPKWQVAARRALVERLMEQLATTSEYAAVDALASLLALSYQGRNATTSVAVDPAKAPPAHAGAAQHYLAWRQQAEKVVPAQGSPVRLDMADRRRAGRFGQAEGMVQAFAAEQASICEVMAYVIAAERPARSDQVRLILSSLAQERRSSPHVLDQVRAGERAMVQLWLVRLGEGAP